MAVCVAVIGKDNGPLYLRVVVAAGSRRGSGGVYSCETSKDLEYHYIVSSALDIIEERVQSTSSLSKSLLNSSNSTAAPPTVVGQQQYYNNESSVVSSGGGGGGTRELYLGSLSAHEDHKVYGYMTNTRIKLILVIQEQTHSSLPIRENDIRMMFRKLHGAFSDLMSNPFYSPGTIIQSGRFCSVVDSILLKT